MSAARAEALRLVGVLETQMPRCDYDDCKAVAVVGERVLWGEMLRCAQHGGLLPALPEIATLRALRSVLEGGA